MSQTVYPARPPTSLPRAHMTPSSPDPTPLRMLAFSVAEAALQSNPNSPMFTAGLSNKIPTPPRVQVMERPADWLSEESSMHVGLPAIGLTHQLRWAHDQYAGKMAETAARPVGTIAQRRNQDLRSMVERVQQRRHTFEDDLPTPPPLSPSYNFTLPPNSPLAESIAAEASRTERREALAKLGRLAVRTNHTGLYTRSAEPSPVEATFSGLDQTRPPPEFVPRLTAREFSAKAGRIAEGSKAKHARTQSDADSPDLVSPTEAVFPAKPEMSHRVTAARHGQRLPSLQQIQAKMGQTSISSPENQRRGHRRTGSVDSMPVMVPKPASLINLNDMVQNANARPATIRKGSNDSAQSEASDIIQTPEDEMPNPLRERRLALQAIMGAGRRPPTPPSPAGKDRLAMFLRERTSDRLASGKQDRYDTATPTKGSNKPVLTVTPPTYENRLPTMVSLLSESSTTVPAPSPSPTRSSFMLSRLARQAEARQAEGRAGAKSPIDRFQPPARLSTPPLRAISHTYGSLSRPTTPISPTGSIRSMRSFSAGTGIATNATNSPASMPKIICTPAEDPDSDDGRSEPDVVVFDAEQDLVEREKRGSEMRAKLGLRRRSID